MGGEDRQRLDRWLFFARVTKSRTLAAKLIEAGGVRLNREKCRQPAQQIRVGDVLTVSLERRVMVLRVLSPGARRGPAVEARTLYEDLAAPTAQPSGPAVEAPRREPGSGRPEKKDRRALDRLRESDSD
ncbi:MAG: RNA-binding S4 domain-containing protein [Rhizobiaceae bacterium]|nr:RNA-binding S4 domain-containing protein [Rhizobiaceae bacterium]MCV0404612.1 RNA-binding S4 domain-containing protein [Rhizobiaceae bacterium]